MDQTEAEYFASHAEQCRSAALAAADSATEFAHRELAMRYEQWWLVSAAKASGMGGAGE